MRIRKAGDSPTAKMWDIPEIMNHLKCDEMKARKIMDSYHHENGGYGPVEKALMLDYIERKQREEREREARYQRDISTAETVAILKEQLKFVKTLAESSSKEARTARLWALAASILSVIATISAAFIPWILSRF